ncbi:alanine racemase [Novosphingobium marinum]|uniref:D-serine deaminase-like pyridoxal phosphate-dependent protein n=1 Tax=Novosphingobium marinum TaxID=1514948 RepID=A0A7Y9XYS9_9SPHN|nr:DSD1 family PLP-dependent enzyme [Novosphingobium marinum]NYH97121.1 D-serine deaminase-like pyridoxal phosphate-dependent protein [Novosphingobium marinum]GGC43608.1 alanine racemase [Novosphingobium marinum]
MSQVLHAPSAGPRTLPSLSTLPTPALVLDRDRMDRNVARLSAIAARHDVILRPHLKTAKSVEAARRIFPDGPGPITVSTLAEAEYFAREGGYRDITYAVGLDPAKVPRALAIAASGVDLKVTLDSVAQAEALGKAARDAPAVCAAFIEIDCDGHRGGLSPGDPLLIVTASELAAGGVPLAGVLTHAGDSYGLSDPDALAAAAEGERIAALSAAQALRTAGFECPIISVGSTPTAHFARNLDGITEVRAGVFMFFDLVMAGIGVCDIDDLALTVLTTVIGRKAEKDWILVDAGWMALSRDRGTARQDVDQGYGLVCDLHGRVIPDLIVDQANQEHGIVTMRAGSARALPDLPIGTRLRILPNHACATGAQHDAYRVVEGDGDMVIATWSRMRGW